MKAKKKEEKVNFTDSHEFELYFSVEAVPENKLRKAFQLQNRAVLLAEEIYEIKKDNKDVQESLNILLVAFKKALKIVKDEW